jgi:hypothetical protein
MTDKFMVTAIKEAENILKHHPEIKYRPLVNAGEIVEIFKVFDKLPKLEYPINSAAELIYKLGGKGKTLDIEGMAVDPIRMMKYMPAYYFPIASPENFIEKMVELVRANRKAINVPNEVKNIKNQLPELCYPINNVEQLVKMIGQETKFKFREGSVQVKDVSKYVTADYFPITSEEDFHKKIWHMIVAMPLIKRD